MTVPAATITLPAGLWLEGVCHREATLRPLTGEDEALLAEASAPTAQRVTMLLARCVARVGSVEPATPEIVRALPVGDREALLLHLRRASMGDRMACVADCPACEARMDLDLSATELLVPPAPRPARHAVEVEDGGRAYRVVFRLPTGGDQEAAALLARDDPEGAAEVILRRCVEKATAGGEPAPPPWPAAVTDAVVSRMREGDPQAEIALLLACPECGHSFESLLDAGAWLLGEATARARRLYREVHLLAFHYHWSAAEILAMTPARRRIFLDLLEEALGAGEVA